jgi:hypothetical protein
LILLALALTVLPVGAAQMRTLSGHVPTVVKRLTPTGRLSAGTQLNLAIGLPLRNPAALSNLLHQIYDPASPNYRHYLTPAQFTEQFGPTEDDYRALIAFAAANHLQVAARHANRMLLDVRGPVADIEQAFHVALRIYQHPTEKRTFYAPDTEPSLDLSVPVLHISGLDNQVLPRPSHHPLTSPSATPASGSAPEGFYMGNDFRNAYVPGVSLTGAGQSVGLLEFDSGFYQSDMTAYETLAHLPNVPVQAVLLDGYDGGPGTKYNGGNEETSLDIEMVMSMAPGVSKIDVFEGSLTDDILNAMAASNQVRQLSASWGYPIDATSEQIFQQFAAQGQSYFNASGDSDAYGNAYGDGLDTPCDDPYITIVGGTALTMNGTGNSYSSEIVWNWGGNAGTGGGISPVYPIPSWQAYIIMTACQGSTTMRNSPDVAMTADGVWVICGNGAQGGVGGTSCASPLWAGFAALCNQLAANNGGAPVGFINPAIYAIGAGSDYTNYFHDITVGDNRGGFNKTNYFAVPGYDLCTGWGTPNGQNLINALGNPDPMAINAAVNFFVSGGKGGPFFPAAFQVFALTNIGTNTLTWTLSNTAAWLNVSATSGTLSPGGPAATVTASLNTVASNLVVGTYNATLSFTNQNDNFNRNFQFQLSVIAPPSITQQPTNVAVLENQTAVFSVQVAGGGLLVYQWQLNGTNLADAGNVFGSTIGTLTISNVTVANAGTYAFVVTNTAGLAVSSNALLTIIPSPPVIVSQPTNVTMGPNGSATFSVAVIGTIPYSFQWSQNETSLPGATNPVLTLASVQYTNAGNYAVLVTNRLGSALSSNAMLTIAPCVPLPSGAVAWWPAEGNTGDAVGTNTGALQGGATYATGQAGQAFSLNGKTAGISVLASPGLNVGLAEGMTIEGWINPQRLTNQFILEWHKASPPTFGVFLATGPAGGGVYADLVDTSGTAHFLVTAPGILVSNQFQHVAVTYDKTSGAGILYVNGVVEAADFNMGAFTPQTSYPLYLGEQPGLTTANFAGLLDEFSIYNRALSGSEIYAIYLAHGSGKCAPPPLITQQPHPASQTATAGDTATFTVNAASLWPLNYQWNFKGTNLAGATGSSLTLTDVQVTNAGSYSVLIANPSTTTNSAAAMLTVQDVLDHFAWTNIPSPRFANTPFGVAIQALDPIGLLFTNFTGTIALTTTNGASVKPASSSPFVQGAWSGFVTTSQAVSNLVLNADDGAGQTGLANPIDVLALPALSPALSGGSLLIYWPTNPSGFVLEVCTNLVSPQWTQVPAPVPSGDQNLESIQITSTNQFYRLHYTLP